MENYTLNRFYFEAKLLLEKYKLYDKEDYKLRVEFGIREQDNKTTALQCYICFEYKNDQRTIAKPITYFGFGSTPSFCLRSFEDSLRDKTENPLIINVSVEI